MKRMFLEKWDNDLEKIIPIVDFIPVAVLMVGAIIFLKINAAATKITLQLIQNVLVLFDEFYVEFWLYSNSPF